MQLKAQVLADMVSGQLEGDPEVIITSPAKIEEATEGQITFLANPKYEDHIYSTEASVVLVEESFQARETINATLIRVKDVYATLGLLLSKFGNGMDLPKGVSEHAQVAETSDIADDASIGAFAIISDSVTIGKGSRIFGQVYIGKGVQIGESVTIYPGAKVYSQCVIGDRCVVHSNAVIGSDGFGFAPTEDGKYKKIDQIGNVVLESDVEIGANTVLDRATMGSTIVRSGTKLDNLIQIGHNVEIGSDSVIAALSGIAGSTKIGKNTQIGGQVGIAGHLNMEDGLMIQAGSKVHTNPGKEGAKLFGYPAIDYVQYIRAYSVFRNLPDLKKRLEALEIKLGKDKE